MANIPATPAAAVATGNRVSPSPRSSPCLPRRTAMLPSIGAAAGPPSWSSRGAAAVARAATGSDKAAARTIINPNNVPVLSFSEVAERLDTFQASGARNQNYMAMYSSIFGGITKDPSAMVIPIDDHMVHRGHGVFDTAAIMDGHLYELEQHLDRFLRSALMAKIPLPFDRSTIRSILIQTVSASNCTQGSLRYWLSVGPGDFQLSSSGCANPALYAVVIESPSLQVPAGCKVVTSSIPIKSPQFAVMKSVNYLPNALTKVEGEENGAFTSIWLDDEGFVAEGSNMNVGFVTADKELLMPRFDKILSGCTAKRVLTLAEQLVADGRLSGIISRNVSVQEGKSADEMMLIGSGILVKPVVQWDDQIIGSGQEGPIAQALYGLILEDMRSGPPSVLFRWILLGPCHGCTKISPKDETIVLHSKKDGV
ncbi:D-amino-acid transaminase, chloroplastic isoform X2 [Panicum hallii]|uniref:D-amino-acid transaminase, chloroplastic isoform X2 n=1 Tax=Panicum hallii TaxID=206008 RepID=UPI000DF4D96A|nr:D-amino-acid transaminase, chloroplastic isoform X2 [Panicum hallii]